MERHPYPPPGSCVAKNSQRPVSVETVQGGVPPYGVKETLVVKIKISAIHWYPPNTLESTAWASCLLYLPHPVMYHATVCTYVHTLVDILSQLDQTGLIVTSYCTQNQTGTPGQIQGLGNLNGHISCDENCLELFGQVPEGLWSLEDMDREFSIWS